MRGQQVTSAPSASSQVGRRRPVGTGPASWLLSRLPPCARRPGSAAGGASPLKARTGRATLPSRVPGPRPALTYHHPPAQPSPAQPSPRCFITNFGFTVTQETPRGQGCGSGPAALPSPSTVPTGNERPRMACQGRARGDSEGGRARPCRRGPDAQ